MTKRYVPVSVDTAQYWVDRYRKLTGKWLTNRDVADRVQLFNAEVMYRRATTLLQKVHCQHGYTAMDSCPGCDYDEENGNPIVWTDRN